MNLFPTPGADAAYDRRFDPPEVHEDDDCERCHEAHLRDVPVIEAGFERCKADACRDCGGTRIEKLHVLKCPAFRDPPEPCACLAGSRDCVRCGATGWDPEVVERKA